MESEPKRLDCRFEKRLAYVLVVNLAAYAKYLAIADLKGKAPRIRQVMDLMELLGTFHGIEGIENDSPARIHEKYLKPIEELLDGKPFNTSLGFVPLDPDILRCGLTYFRQELINEQDTVYHPQIQLCGELIGEISGLLMMEEWQEEIKMDGVNIETSL